MKRITINLRDTEAEALERSMQRSGRDITATIGRAVVLLDRAEAAEAVYLTEDGERVKVVLL